MAQVSSQVVGIVCLLRGPGKRKRHRPFSNKFPNANFILQTSTWPGDLAANSPIPYTRINNPKYLHIECLAHTYWGLKAAEEVYRQVDPCVPTSVPSLLVEMVQQVPARLPEVRLPTLKR